MTRLGEGRAFGEDVEQGSSRRSEHEESELTGPQSWIGSSHGRVILSVWERIWNSGRSVVAADQRGGAAASIGACRPRDDRIVSWSGRAATQKRSFCARSRRGACACTSGQEERTRHAWGWTIQQPNARTSIGSGPSFDPASRPDHGKEAQSGIAGGTIPAESGEDRSQGCLWIVGTTREPLSRLAVSGGGKCVRRRREFFFQSIWLRGYVGSKLHQHHANDHVWHHRSE